MTSPNASDSTTIDWGEILKPYRSPILWRSVWQLTSSAALFILAWYLAYRSLEVGWWLTLLMAIPTATMIMRLFMVQHDCGHGSFFKSKRANSITGAVIGVITLVPYTYWRKTHAIHHATSGDLDGRDFGDIDTLTVREYLSRPKNKRLMYRFYRHPAILLLIGPTWQFIIKHRLPLDTPRKWKREWASVHFTNLALLAVVALMSWWIGWRAFLAVQIPVSVITGSMGVYLFYVQHQYEDTYWRYHERWDYHASGLEGASHLVMPRFLQWCTASIGLHHIHHIASKIPNYRLQRCFDENPELQHATTLTIRESFKTLWLTLWDEDDGRLVRFKDLGKIRERIASELEAGAAILATKPEAVPRNWR